MVQIKTFESFINDNDEKILESLNNLSDMQRKGISEMNRYINDVLNEMKGYDSSVKNRIMVVYGDSTMVQGILERFEVNDNETIADDIISEEISPEDLFKTLCIRNNKFVVFDNCPNLLNSDANRAMLMELGSRNTEVSSPAGSEIFNDVRIRFKGFVIIITNEDIKDSGIEARAKVIDLR